MTCGPCVNAVTTELSAVDGVVDVAVDLATGRATVTSRESLSVPPSRRQSPKPATNSGSTT